MLRYLKSVSFRLHQLDKAFSNWLAEHAMPRRSSFCEAEAIPITEGAPSISTRIGAPEYPKFVRHRYINVLSS